MCKYKLYLILLPALCVIFISCNKSAYKALNTYDEYAKIIDCIFSTIDGRTTKTYELKIAKYSQDGGIKEQISGLIHYKMMNRVDSLLDKLLKSNEDFDLDKIKLGEITRSMMAASNKNAELICAINLYKISIDDNMENAVCPYTRYLQDRKINNNGISGEDFVCLLERKQNEWVITRQIGLGEYKLGR